MSFVSGVEHLTSEHIMGPVNTLLQSETQAPVVPVASISQQEL